MMEVAKKGVTLVPLKIYFNEKGLVKLELALAKHKKAHERKEEIKERDIARETRRELRGKYDI
jgi:SsrA-binding protein